MTEDEVAKLAREAGDDWDHTLPEDREFLIRFANLVLASRKPLTDAAIWRTYQGLWPFHPAEEPALADDILKFARAIEAAHDIGDKT